jgi:hypothetical protein
VGFLTFKLVLNVPCLMLKDSTKDPLASSSLVRGRCKTHWADLSYLPLETETGDLSDHFAIYESQTTVVISGCDHSKWFGFAFGSIGPDDPSPDEDNVDQVDAEQVDVSDLTPLEDLFATGGSENVFDLRDTIWDPRVYFLSVARIRIDIATQGYEYLVRTIEAGARDWVSRRCYAK